MELCSFKCRSNTGMYFIHLLCVCSLLCSCVQEYWKTTLEFQVSFYVGCHFYGFFFFFRVEVILQDFEDLIYPQGSQAHIGFGYFVVRMILNL